jgi:tetratricopeptide (TPR) repeat protein
MSQELMASMQYAESLLKGRDPEGALKALGSALAARPVLPRAHMIAAMAKLRQGRPGEAVGHLDIAAAVLDRAAAAPVAYLTLARHYSGARAFDHAGEMLRKGRARFPDNAELAVAAGDHCERLGRRGEAIAAYRAAIALAPDSGEAWSSLAIALHKNGDMAAAIEGYGQALAHGARTGGVYNNLIAALIATGDPAAALKTAEDWLAAMPGSIEALSFKALLLTETGHRAEAERLIDFDRFMRVETIEVPQGYQSLDQFNRALEAEVLAHPKLATPPENHPTWHHPALRIANLKLDGKGGPIDDLHRIMRQSVDNYFTATAGADRHPFVAHRPRAVEIAAWAAVLEGEGNQQPHVHVDGYLSGCYYVTIPQEIASDDNGRDGVILGGFEAGRPPEDLGLKTAFPSRTIKPREGMMVLFPAYLYHATVPFRSSERRISIAFDVLPEGGRPKRR